MNIKRKLALSTALSVLFLFMMAVAGWFGYRSVTYTAATVNAFEKEMFYLQMAFRGVNESILTEGTPYSVDLAKRGMVGFEHTQKILLARLHDPELEDALTRKIVPKWQTVRDGIEPFLEINAVSSDDAELMMNYGALLSVEESLEKDIQSAINHIQLDSSLSVRRTQYAMAAIALGLLATMSLLQLNLYRTIAIPINKLRMLMKDISEGKTGWEERLNLKSEVISRTFDEKEGRLMTRVEDIQALAAAFNGMIKRIAAYIEERKQMEKEIMYCAYHDNLTRLPNRLLLMDHLNQAIMRMQRQRLFVAVLFLDLDRFKFVNDTMGHAVGDTLLKIVAKKLKDCVRQSDTVARLGGDEFVIILSDIEKKEDIFRTMKRIFSAFDSPISLQGKTVFISTSIGVSIYPDDGEDAETLIKNADIAMYKAKKEGQKVAGTIPRT
jgi:diguanylate cyclase (GGDEF)-like protein